MRRDRALAALVPALWLCHAGAGRARILLVGPDQDIKTPSAAVKIAKDGDTIRIDPVKDGYFDCAIVRQSHLTIEGAQDGVVLTDDTCGSKAILVIDGTDVTVRNLTLARARVPDENGAGIRAEGTDLHVEGVRFVNNEVGILASESPGSRIVIENSQFIDNGKCTVRRCDSALMIGAVALLHVEHSLFRDTHGGDVILSTAARTELIDDDIADGPTGTARYLVHLPWGGALEMRNNRLEKGSKTGAVSAAISAEAPYGSRPLAPLILDGNRFANDSGRSFVLLDNLSGTSAELTNNVLGPETELESTRGYPWFWMKSFARTLLTRSRSMAHDWARGVRDYLRVL
jgi:hypothetical protein